MPIGENAIKRVENNGYSGVVTSAPDMENSVVEVPAEEPKKTSKRTKRTVPAQGKDGFVRVEIGGEMPVWLL